MNVPPRFSATIQSFGSSHQAKHCIEIYYDYMCPWCVKMSRTLDSAVVPWLRESSFRDKMDLVIRPQVQPWDLPSVFATEAALIVNALAPGDAEVFWKFTRTMGEEREKFLATKMKDERRNDTYKRLAKIIGDCTGIEESKAYDLLEVKEGDRRSQLTLDMKRVTKAMRKVGNHVTPTVYFNGLEEPGIDSGFTGEQWRQWIEKNIV